MFKPKGPLCQSCGMPLSKDVQGGGTNTDGTISQKYCSRCYTQGAFTDPDITLEQMTEKVKGKLHDMKIPGFLVGMFTKDLPKLERWSSGGKN